MAENPSRPKAGVVLATLDSLPPGAARVVDFAHGEARFSLILAHGPEGVVAYENRCPHAGLPMERPDGAVVVQDGAYLVCSAHGASFHITDGAHVGGPCPARARLAAIAIVVDAGVISLA